MSETPNTNPVEVGTRFIQAVGNTEIYYTVGVVYLYAPVNGEDITLTAHDPIKDSEGNYTINYDYTYPDSEPSSELKGYALHPTKPIKDDSETIDFSVTVTVKNSTTNESKSGEVKTLKPLKLNELPPGEIPSDVEYDVVRIGVFISTQEGLPDSDANEAATSLYFIFIIVKTTDYNQRNLFTEFSDTTVQCSYIPEGNNMGENIAAVSYVSANSTSQYTHVTLNNGNPVEISFEDPEHFDYGLESELETVD